MVSATTPSIRCWLRRAALGVAVVLVWQMQLPDASAQISLTTVSTPAAVVINTTVSGAGSAPANGTTSGTMRATSKTANPYKIMARLSAALPTGVTLTVSSAGIGTSLGTKTLSTTDVDVINAIGRNLTNILVTNSYTLSATSASGVRGSTAAGVVYTIVAY